MKDKMKRYVFVLGLLVVSIAQFSFVSQANELSNEMLAWGFRRGENHTQPVLYCKRFKPQNWRKRSAKACRRNYTVLP